MRLCAIVPMKSLANIKLRLSEVLEPSQRRELSLEMLADVTDAVRASKHIDHALLVSADNEALRFGKALGLTPVKEGKELGVNAAVSFAERDYASESSTSSVVIPADLPLISPEDLDVVADLGKGKRCVVISPSRRLDGTNLLLRNPINVMETSYENDSFNNHLRNAIQSNCRVKLYVSPSAQLDIDLPDDLQEFLRMPSRTRSQQYLRRLQAQGMIRLPEAK